MASASEDAPVLVWRAADGDQGGKHASDAQGGSERAHLRIASGKDLLSEDHQLGADRGDGEVDQQ